MDKVKKKKSPEKSEKKRKRLLFRGETSHPPNKLFTRAKHGDEGIFFSGRMPGGGLAATTMHSFYEVPKKKWYSSVFLSSFKYPLSLRVCTVFRAVRTFFPPFFFLYWLSIDRFRDFFPVHDQKESCQRSGRSRRESLGLEKSAEHVWVRSGKQKKIEKKKKKTNRENR